MPKFDDNALARWAKPPSESEETKLQNSERMVSTALREDGEPIPLELDYTYDVQELEEARIQKNKSA